jgi:predicted transcriptional regulator
MMNEARRTKAELEREVMTALTTGGHPMTLEQVRERLQGRVMCTTVMTVLGRLGEKGLARRERVGQSFVYTPLATPAQVTADGMRRLLDTGDDQAAVLARFVGMLAPEEERLLSSLLRERSAAGATHAQAA